MAVLRDMLAIICLYWLILALSIAGHIHPHWLQPDGPENSSDDSHAWYYVKVNVTRGYQAGIGVAVVMRFPRHSDTEVHSL